MDFSDVSIILLDKSHVKEYIKVITSSFYTVAENFNLTKENCPYHPAFYTEELLLNKFNENYYPFGYYINHKMIGFVSIQNKKDNIWSINNLAVLPEYRNYGIGKRLLDFSINKISKLNGKKLRLILWKKTLNLKTGI